MKTIEYKTFSHAGTGKANEDYVLCRQLSDNSLIAVLADGMGGLSYGAEAAKIVSESILTTILDEIQNGLPEDVLRLAFDTADTAIHLKCKELKCKMGAAVVVALIVDDVLYYAWQGNVRLYKIGNGEPLLLTTDHIAEGMEGVFLTRCVNGKGYRENIPVMYEDLRQADNIIVCTDGFYQNMNLTALRNHDRVLSAENMPDDYSFIAINLV